MRGGISPGTEGVALVVDDSMWAHLDTPGISAEAAQSKRPSLNPDAPTQQPMRAGIRPAQQKAPSNDQKKHRRQMSKNAHEESIMTNQPTEADLLTRLAAATTLAEQADLSAQIENLRAARRESVAQSDSIDWDNLGTTISHVSFAETVDSLPGLTLHAAMHRHSDATDWLDDITPTHTEDAVLTAQARAQATQWYENLWAPVKDSLQEFSVQAHNAASRTSLQFGLQATAAKSVFLSQVQHLASREGISLEAEWGKDPYDQADGTTVDTYVSDGKTTQPVGVQSGTADTFDEWGIGSDSNGNDPKSTSNRGEAPSLKEGDQPESGSNEGVDNPNYGKGPDASSGSFSNDKSDKMTTQGSLADRMAAEFGSVMNRGIETYSSLQAEADGSTSADGQGSTQTATEAPSLNEGDTPESGHQESPVQEPGQGATDKSAPTESDRPGGGVNWKGSSANSQVFVTALSRMASLDESVGGVTGHQIAALLLADESTPAEVKTALKEGVNPFAREAGTGSEGYLGKKPDTGDHCPAEPGVKDRMCGQAARGAIGDCVRPKGHDGFHQGAHFYSWTDEFNAGGGKTSAEAWKVGDFLERDGKRYQITRITPAGSGATSYSDGPTYHAAIVDPETGQAKRGGYTADIWSKSMSNPTSAYTKVSGGGKESSLQTEAYGEEKEIKASDLKKGDVVLLQSNPPGRMEVVSNPRRKRVGGEVKVEVDLLDKNRSGESRPRQFRPDQTVRVKRYASLSTEAGTNQDTHEWGKWGCNKCGMDKPDSKSEWVPKCSDVTEGFGDPKTSSLAGFAQRVQAGLRLIEARPRHRDTFSLSDAKNEDGEWTMSPEQIRAEMNADEDPFYEEVDDEGYSYASLKTGGLQDLDDAALDKELRRVMEQQNNTRKPEAQDALRSWRKEVEQEQARRKSSAKQAMPNPVDLGVKVGDFFYSSWGYDQTNIDFYQVVGLTGASVRVREVGKRVVDAPGSGAEYVVPIPDQFVGPIQTKRIQGYSDRASFSVNSYSGAYHWDGKPKYQTASGWGH